MLISLPALCERVYTKDVTRRYERCVIRDITSKTISYMDPPLEGNFILWAAIFTAPKTMGDFPSIAEVLSTGPADKQPDFTFKASISLDQT